MPHPGSLLGDARGLLWQAVALATAAIAAVFRLSDPPAAAPMQGPFPHAEGEDNQLI